MPRKSKPILTPEEAAALIPQDATITISSSAAQLVPDRVLAGIESRFLARGEPADLTVVFPLAVGDSFGMVGLGTFVDPRDQGGRMNRVTPPGLVEVIQLDFTVEQGSISGLPLTGFAFGASHNPEAIIDSAAQFDLIDGGGISVGCLAFAEIDGDGNANVSRLSAQPHVLAGAGGFMS